MRVSIPALLLATTGSVSIIIIVVVNVLCFTNWSQKRDRSIERILFEEEEKKYDNKLRNYRSYSEEKRRSFIASTLYPATMPIKWISSNQADGRSEIVVPTTIFLSWNCGSHPAWAWNKRIYKLVALFWEHYYSQIPRRKQTTTCSITTTTNIPTNNNQRKKKNSTFI